MENNTLFFINIKTLKNTNQPEKIKFELCSIIPTFFLSKDYFKHTKDIQPFLDKLNLSFKDYVFKNRILLLGKFLKIILGSSDDQVLEYKSTICEIIFQYYEDCSDTVLADKNKKRNITYNKNNYMKELLLKYSRNKLNG
ncbi:hypothetical protein [Pectinatus haikarae]|uniref:Uncharacterized protein n=1 Tax=Pectinatus haikarae TaxID=349096 RepID=A0ABT9Y4M2_9FIRM|nr:hypothetical protein [Pectinatus haikarae]MDQ0202455.1 hypothetical protein [Pectinatus haikarae]